MHQVKSILSAIASRICFHNPKLYISCLRKRGVTIGEGTWFAGRISIDTTRACLVEIGRNCVLTDGVVLLTHGFEGIVLREKYGELISSSGKVSIEDNVFIGVNSIILKGVKIGKNTVIGAGSVVTHDIPENSVAAGMPCKVIMTLDQYYMKRKNEYLQEAKEYALELYKKKKRVPRMEDFWEEFPLFLDRQANWGKLPVRKQLGSAFGNFAQSKPIYASFDDFLIDAGVPKEQVEKSRRRN